MLYLSCGKIVFMSLSDFSSVVLYLAVFSAAIACAYIGQKKNSKTFYALAILLPAILVGFRGLAGTDTEAYRNFYSEISSESIGESLERIANGGMEPFAVLISLIGNALRLPASFMLLTFALITAAFFYATARLFNREKAWLFYGVILFIVFPEGMNMMRQLAAVSVQAFALMYVIRTQQANKKTRWLLVLVLALLSISLHYSSLLLLPAFILPVIVKHTAHEKSLALIMFIFVAICLFAFPSLLNFIAGAGILPEKHYNTFLDSGGSIININFFCSTILTAILFANYHRRGNPDDKSFSFLMLAGAIYSAVGFYSGYFGRLSTLFWVFIVIIASDLLCQLFEKNGHRFVACAAVAISYFLLYYCVIGFNAIMPYSFAL